MWLCRKVDCDGRTRRKQVTMYWVVKWSFQYVRSVYQVSIGTSSTIHHCQLTRGCAAGKTLESCLFLHRSCPRPQHDAVEHQGWGVVRAQTVAWPREFDECQNKSEIPRQVSPVKVMNTDHQSVSDIKGHTSKLGNKSPRSRQETATKLACTKLQKRKLTTFRLQTHLAK